VTAVAVTLPRRHREVDTTSAVDPTPRVVVTTTPAAAWWRTYRYHLRALRGGAVAWIVGLAGISWGVAATFEDRYSTPEELAAFAEFEGVPAFEAMLGRLVGLTTLEGGVLSRWGIFGVLAALWGMTAAVRLLRRAEETGHLEPLRAGIVSARGHLTSVLAALATVFAALGVAIGVSHTAAGMDAATSWALGVAAALVAATAAASGALASQLASSHRRALGLAGAALGVAFAVRLAASASATPEWVWWATPLGWLGFLHELDQARTVVFLAYLGLLAVLLAATYRLVDRDLHAAWLRSGADAPSRTPRPVRGPGGLALRLVAGPVRTWGLVAGSLALAFGLLARDFSVAVADLETMAELTEMLGYPAMDTAEGAIGFAASWVAVVLAVFAATQVAAIREEEASWRIEHLLARPLGRTRWLLTRVGTSAVAATVVAGVAGVLAWAGTALVGTPIALADGLLAGVNVIPVAWLVLGVGVGLVGVAPRLAVPVTYTLVVATYLLDFVGGMLELPEAVLDLSPFRHLAAVPAADPALGAALVMIAVAVVAAAVGCVAFRRRDLKEA
jgi:ABC-2 type transport system permease protein